MTGFLATTFGAAFNGDFLATDLEADLLEDSLLTGVTAFLIFFLAGLATFRVFLTGVGDFFLAGGAAFLGVETFFLGDGDFLTGFCSGFF